ncbi:MAG: type II toxin-antitoxin system RatA family toxin [Pseudomonadota bacterium]|nr:type II toxin-antitoxin system RatA family toxin [Pseudomonadota bacterium]MEC9414666.1 type II toxin-antitoxin system RatA family toxin [Pseudomonadota bacterium]
MIKIEKKKRSTASSKDLFELISDIKSYPDFIPWCKSSIIEREVHDYFFARLEMKFLMFSGSFISKVSMDKYEKRINALGVKGPFNYLEANWIFDEYDKGTLVSLILELDLKNKILEDIIEKNSENLINKTILSFEKRILTVSENGKNHF